MKRRNFIGSSSLILGGSAIAPDKVFAPPEKKESWPPDGRAMLGRLGLLTIDFDTVPETEIRAMAPQGISLHSSRLRYTRNDPDSFAAFPNIDNAAMLLMSLGPKAILYGFTSSSYTLGAGAEQQVVERLQQLTNGIPVILPCKAATAAFRLFNAQKIAIVHPPWFSNEISKKGQGYFEGQGFDVIYCDLLTPARQFTEVEPAELCQWIPKHVPQDADLIFIGGNGLRVAGAIAKLENVLKKPVVAANQVLLWAALQLFNGLPDVNHYGTLFNRHR